MVQFDKLLLVCIAGYFLNFSFKKRTKKNVRCAGQYQERDGEEYRKPGGKTRVKEI